MCKSVAEGGQRCAAHTRERLKTKATVLETAIGAGDPAKAAVARIEWESAAAEYASTDEGHAYLSDAASRADTSGDADTAAMLSTLVRKGEAIRAANRETSALLAAVKMTSAPVEGYTPAGRPSAAVVPEGDEMVAWISDKDRVTWDEYEAATGRLSLFVEKFPRDHTTPQEKTAVFTEAVATVSDPDATEAQLIKASVATNVNAYASRYWGPQFKKYADLSEEAKTLALGSLHVPGSEEPDPGFDNRQQVESRNRAFDRTQWRLMAEAGEAADAARDTFTRALLDHPNASEAVFARVAKFEGNTSVVTGHPKCPEPLLATTIRGAEKERGQVPEAGWNRARSARWENPSMALSLAAHDPDSFHRHEAFNQIMVTPMDSFAEEDRLWLAKNLKEMPSSEEGHVTLAYSLTSWAQGYGDAQERDRLGKAFVKSDNAKIRAYGRRLQGLPEEDPAEPKRSWFRG